MVYPAPCSAAADCDVAPVISSYREQLLSALTNEHEREARQLLTGLSATADRRALGSQQVDALELELAKLAMLASRDELTGLYNRRAFIGMGTRVLELAAKSDVAPLLLYCDVDALKAVNDGAGHAAGDDLLCRAAEALGTAFRETDLVARMGGDEFAALVGMDSTLSRHAVVQRVQKAVAATNRDVPRFPLSLSIGLATFDPDRPVALKTLLAAADGNMFRRKRARQAVTAPRGTGIGRIV
jgi:diguanylate cyclase (GGDEF)-like protein